MAINKVVYGNDTLVDLTEDTVTPEKLLQGETAHDKSGNPVTGTAKQGHIVQNSSGADMTQRNTIQFKGVTVTDDATNGKTVVQATKTSVGLGNVPNVTTDNQKPTVTEASTRANLASGDTLKTIIGKIKKFFTDLKAVAFSGLASDVIMSDGVTSVEQKILNLVSKSKDIEIIIPPTITDYVSYKNAGGNRGENITKYWKDGSLADRIDGVNGFKPFEDLYLWDYIDLDSNITAPSSGGGTVTGTRRIHIGEFNGLNNYQLNKRSDNVNFFNHLRMVTGTHFGMSKMNDTNTTEGGYLGSKMHTAIIGNISTSGTLAKQLYDQLGSLLVPTTELLTNSINASGYNRFGANSGCSNNWAWADVYARLLSELESNGSIVWSSSGYDTGNAQHQLPAFKNDKAAAYPQGIYYWNKDIATSVDFCDSRGNYGNARYHNASYVAYVRLLLTLGRKPS